MIFIGEFMKNAKIIGACTDLGVDVEVSERSYFDPAFGSKNCHEVVLDGKTVGYCGE